MPHYSQGYVFLFPVGLNWGAKSRDKGASAAFVEKKDSDGMDSGEAGELSFGAPLGFAPLSLLPDLSVFNSIFIA